jgi:prolyl oligopeptidase
VAFRAHEGIIRVRERRWWRWCALVALGSFGGVGLVSAEPADPHRWLEDVGSKRALSFVRAHNEKSRRALARGAAFAKLEKRLLSILDSEEKIPSVQKYGSTVW